MEYIRALEYIEENKDFLLPNDAYTGADLERALMAAPNGIEMYLSGISYRKPSTVQLIAVFPGSLGVDRFFLGDIGKGILKYFTFGGFGIWWALDIFSAKERCRAYNCKKLLKLLSDPRYSIPSDYRYSVPNAQNFTPGTQNTNGGFQQAVHTAKQFQPLVKEVVQGAKSIGQTFHMDH